jgi:hypothetical protein
MQANITQPDSPGRLATGCGLIRAGIYLIFHRNVALPGYSEGLPLTVTLDDRAGHDERVAELKALAAAMGVEITRRNGIMLAVRRFGPVYLRAHVSDADYTRQFSAVRDNAADAARDQVAA